MWGCATQLVIILFPDDPHSSMFLPKANLLHTLFLAPNLSLFSSYLCPEFYLIFMI